MKFMTIVKGPELTAAPPAALIDGIMALGEEAKKAGVFVGWGGLHPTSEGTRARITKGKITVTDGPFTEAKEVIGGFTTYDVASKAEALDWTRRFLELHVKYFPEWEGEVEIRQLFDEPSD